MRTRVLILGHSHVRRLRGYVRKFRNGLDIKLNFNVSDAYVEMAGFSGLKTGQLLEPFVIRRIQRFRPHVIILLVGDNDNIPDCDTEEVASNIVARASTLQNRYGVQSVFVCQLLPRYLPSRYLNYWYDRKAHDINQQLLEDIMPLPNMRFVYYGGLRFRAEDEYSYWRGKSSYVDGVHLTAEGYYDLYKALRGVVIQATRL